jgi:hypothetical protein
MSLSTRKRGAAAWGNCVHRLFVKNGGHERPSRALKNPGSTFLTRSRTTTEDEGPATDHMTGSVVASIVSASEEIAARETWSPRGRGVFPVLAPRLVALVTHASRSLDPDGLAARTVRQNALRLMAYMDADLRIAMLLDLAARRQAVIDDLFCGPVDEAFEIYRYNLFSSLGIFARHGLVREVFTEDRLGQVRGAMTRMAARRREGGGK